MHHRWRQWQQFNCFILLNMHISNSPKNVLLILLCVSLPKLHFRNCMQLLLKQTEIYYMKISFLTFFLVSCLWNEKMPVRFSTDVLVYQEIIGIKLIWYFQSLLCFLTKIALQHDKTNTMTCAPSKDSDQPGHHSSLISRCCPHEAALGPWLLNEHQTMTRQTGQIPRLICIFTGRTGHFVHFVVLQLKYPYSGGICDSDSPS